VSEDAPLTFDLIFTLPDYNASKRHIAGGARGQIDIQEESVAAFHRMCDHAAAHHGTVFASVVVVVATNEAEPEKPKVISWREVKRKRH
jgi:hypothetical protein